MQCTKDVSKLEMDKYRKIKIYGHTNYEECRSLLGGSGSVDGIATGYGLDGPGIESLWGDIFRTCPDRPWGPPSFFPGVKSDRDVTLTPHPLLVPWSLKGRAIPLLFLWPYGLYRVSVPVQG